MKRFDSINVIPFIDIMLVLLAIVLTTASFVASSQIEIDLPVAESAVRSSNQQGIELSLAHLGGLFYNDESIDEQELALRLGQLDKAAPIVFRVDREVSFYRFVEVVDLLKQQELASLSILTRDAL